MLELGIIYNFIHGSVNRCYAGVGLMQYLKPLIPRPGKKPLCYFTDYFIPLLAKPGKRTDHLIKGDEFFQV